MEWPGWDDPPPVIIHAGRPARHRPRLATAHSIPRQPVYYTGPNGQLLVPAEGIHRSASVSGQRPAQVIINNDNAVQWDDHHDRRARSAHGTRYYYEEDYDRVVRRERSTSRRRTPSPYEPDPETIIKLRELEEIKRREEEKERFHRAEEELLLKQAKEREEMEAREKEEKELKKKVIAEYKLKEEEERQKKKKEKEKEDEEFKERMRKTLWANGYSNEQIERMMKKAEKKDHGSNPSNARHEEHSTVVALNRPTYIKVHRKYLDPETLDVYEMPWEWDDVSDDSCIVGIRAALIAS